MNEDRNQQQPGQVIDIQLLMKVHTQLLENLQLNTTLRMKYPDEPERFYQSEEELNQLLQQISELSQQNLPIIIQSNLFIPLIKILNHPNIDLALQIINILYQLLQEQPQNDKLFEIYYRWAVWLVQNSLVQALVGILVKINEQTNIQEYQAGLKILKTIQILMNIHDSTYDILAEDKQLFEYLANRIMPNFVIRHKIIDDNKYVSSDVLVALLSNSQKSQHIFSQFSGVEVLLQTISSYQTNLPSNPDQKQFLNNLFSSVSILLINHTLPQNKKTFHEMKGNYLMINFIRKKNEYSSVALKVIANSLTSLSKQEQCPAAHGIISDGGLKYLFAIFKRKGFRGEDVDEQKAIDQNTLTIIYSLVRSSTEVFKDRIQHKLIQNRFQNLERFFQLRAEYSQNISKEQTQQPQTETHNQYLTKLSEGLSFIQTVDKVILILVDQYSKLKPKIKNLFEIYAVQYTDVQTTLKDHYNYVGNKTQKQLVQYMLANNLILLKKLLEKTQTNQKQHKQGKIQ